MHLFPIRYRSARNQEVSAEIQSQIVAGDSNGYDTSLVKRKQNLMCNTVSRFIFHAGAVYRGRYTMTPNPQARNKSKSRKYQERKRVNTMINEYLLSSIYMCVYQLYDRRARMVHQQEMVYWKLPNIQ